MKHVAVINMQHVVFDMLADTESTPKQSTVSNTVTDTYATLSLSFFVLTTR